MKSKRKPVKVVPFGAKYLKKVARANKRNSPNTNTGTGTSQPDADHD